MVTVYREVFCNYVNFITNTNLTKVSIMKPIDKIAAIVASKSNHVDIEFKKSNRVSSMTPLPTRKFLSNSPHDLTGFKYDRLTVIGIYDLKPQNGGGKGANWVVRCTCGRYETRNARGIRKHINSGGKGKLQCCFQCETTMRLNEKADVIPISLKEQFLDFVSDLKSKKISMGNIIAIFFNYLTKGEMLRIMHERELYWKTELEKVTSKEDVLMKATSIDKRLGFGSLKTISVNRK